MENIKKIQAQKSARDALTNENSIQFRKVLAKAWRITSRAVSVLLVTAGAFSSKESGCSPDIVQFLSGTVGAGTKEVQEWPSKGYPNMAETGKTLGPEDQ